MPPNSPDSPESAPIISAELARNVLKADAAAIIRQAKAGKPLSRQQRAFVLSLADGGAPSNATFAANYEELASVLGISSRTLQRYRKIRGHPTARNDGRGHAVDEWRVWIKANGLKQTTDESEGSDEGEGGGSDTAELKKRKLQLEGDRLDLELSIRRGEYLKAEDVRAHWANHVGQAIHLLRNVFENEVPPKIAGMDATAIRAEMMKAIDEVSASSERFPRLNATCKTSMTEPAPASKVCSKCKIHKPLTAFPSVKRGRFGRSSWCYECVAAGMRTHRAKPEVKARIATRRKEKRLANHRAKVAAMLREVWRDAWTKAKGLCAAAAVV